MKHLGDPGIAAGAAPGWEGFEMGVGVGIDAEGCGGGVRGV